jgi:hypothetical protein
MSLRGGLLLHAAIGVLALFAALPAAAAPPASPWVSRDIGDPGAKGSTDVDANGVWTVQGSGEDIFDVTDQFHFAYQPVRGDASLTARFLSLQGGSSEWAKAGLMVRENPSDGRRPAGITA